jgi:hypothetical protein
MGEHVALIRESQSGMVRDERNGEEREPTERTRERSGVRGRDKGCRPLNAEPARERERWGERERE